MYPHRIRLRGPWQCEPLRRQGDNAEEPLPPPCRVTMPCRWSDARPAGFSGLVRFRRPFGYPGRIDAYERVWLTFDGIDGEAEVCLNNHPLGRIQTACEFDVTGLLRPRNELVVDLECTQEQGGLWGEVALEVRCSAFLCDLRRSAILTGDRAELRVSGRVVGVAERPLEVYLLLDRSTIGYQVVEATAEGQAFEIVVADGPAANWRSLAEQGNAPCIQVDLVNGAVVWYTSAGEVRLETVSERSK